MAQRIALRAYAAIILHRFNVGWENQGTNIIDPQVDEKPHIEQKYHRLAGYEQKAQEKNQKLKDYKKEASPAFYKCPRQDIFSV